MQALTIAAIFLLTLALNAQCRAASELPGEPLREECDLVEVNHFYDGDGRLVFDQCIFYVWAGERYHVLAWRIIKTPEQLPVREWNGGGYLTIWHDGAVLRRVSAAAHRETWTQFDPELVERETLPKEDRRELRQK